MTTERRTDTWARERALDPRHSFIVEAPAGSGKTTLLIQRFLRLLSIVEDPESIVAITFTRKAAEEMRSRVLGALTAVRESPQTLDPVTRRWANAALAASDARGWRLLDSPRRLRMQTIDSLSAMLARRGPLMSGYAGNAEVVEDAGRLYRQAAHAALAELGGNSGWAEAIRVVLRHLDNDWERLENLLVQMLSRRDQWLRFVVQDPSREAFEDALGSAVGDELASLAAMLPSALIPALIRLCAFSGDNLLAEYPDDIGAGLAGLKMMPGSDCEDLGGWQAIAKMLLKRDGDPRQRLSKKEGFPAQDPGVAEYKALFARVVRDLVEVPGFMVALNDLRRVPEPIYSASEWRTIEALFMVLKLAAAELKVAFGHAGAVDFVEVSHAALAALGAAQDPTDLGLIFDYQIHHLLIDEFQDTSITQFELIERLVEGWSEGDGRSLFLVGDPMQSIYRFRQAEVSLFVDTCAVGRLASVPLEALQLTTNFRAQAAIIEWINRAVDDMRVDPVCPFADMPRLVAARGVSVTAAVTTHGLISDDNNAETAVVVDIVTRARAEDPEQTIGILVRGRRHLGSISTALIEAGIAVSASEIDRLCDQSIVQDLVALTRALLHPADRTAWLGVLRAPWCGLSLKALTNLFENDSNLTIWQRLAGGIGDAGIAAEERRVLANFCRIVEIAMSAVGRVPIAPLVERTWIALGGPNIYPELSLTHAERYLELLSTCERNETLITAQRLEALLDRRYVAPSQRSGAAVEIMTVHRAKGLEFDVVILPGLGRAPRSEPHRLLVWKQHIGSAGRALLFAPIPALGTSNSGIHAYLSAAEKNELEAEAYRLLYVAMTRAREVLHLVGSVKEDVDGGPSAPASRSFLKILWGAVGGRLNFSRPGAVTKAVSPKDRSEKRQWIRRRQGALEWQHADWTAPSGIATETRTELEFSWASPLAKQIGTVTHAILQLISGDGLSQWNALRIRDMAPFIERRLRGLGVGSNSIMDAREQIVAALTGVLVSDRGRWILSDQHADAESEYALTAIVGGKASNVIIDRTFIDAHGVRWIIDFKTGTHTGGDKDAFIASEQARYRPQLEQYARLLHARDNRPIALGLFFPVLDGWCEWRYSSDRDLGGGHDHPSSFGDESREP